MNTFLLVMTLCSSLGSTCDDYVIDSGLSLGDCNQARIEALIKHKEMEDKRAVGSYIQAMTCAVEDTE